MFLSNLFCISLSNINLAPREIIGWHLGHSCPSIPSTHTKVFTEGFTATCYYSVCTTYYPYTTTPFVSHPGVVWAIISSKEYRALSANLVLIAKALISHPIFTEMDLCLLFLCQIAIFQFWRYH